MTLNDELLSVVPSQDGPESLDLDNLDDVEGHGLKEIVVGLSAAAVMTGGVASAANLSFGGPEPLKTPGAIVNTVNALHDDAMKLTGPTTTAAQQAAAGAAATATTAAGSALTTAGDTVTTVDGLAAGAINELGGTVRPIIADPSGTVLRAVSPTVDKATLGVSKTTTAATAAANAAAEDAMNAASYAITVIDTAVAQTTETATTIVLGLKATDADAGAKAQAKDAWVVAKVGNEVVGSAQMDDGAWTVTIESRHLSSPITFSVGGHHDIAPLTVHMSAS